ncbi:Uncharacterised protein [Mycobacteroides abscessus subsp. abscessus]|nr:Uncharacterised protein [Mycobacteroides abscessus subsp. abscessus]
MNPKVVVAAMQTVTITAIASPGISVMVRNTKMMPPRIHSTR